MANLSLTADEYSHDANNREALRDKISMGGQLVTLGSNATMKRHNQGSVWVEHFERKSNEFENTCQY